MLKKREILAVLAGDGWMLDKDKETGDTSCWILLEEERSVEVFPTPVDLFVGDPREKITGQKLRFQSLSMATIGFLGAYLEILDFTHSDPLNLPKDHRGMVEYQILQGAKKVGYSKKYVDNVCSHIEPPVIHAGGLTPEHVREVSKQIKTWALEINVENLLAEYRSTPNGPFPNRWQHYHIVALALNGDLQRLERYQDPAVYESTFSGPYNESFRGQASLQDINRAVEFARRLKKIT